VLYEKNATLGGNAKTNAWATGDPTAPTVTTGLSVLAWPDAYFHNYNQLLRDLDIPTTIVDLRFFIRDNEQGIMAHSKTSLLRGELRTDMDRWTRMVSIIRRVNACLCRCPYPSIYAMSILNPFNLLSLRLVARLFSVSERFWNVVVIPIYSSSFLTVKLDVIPAVIAPVLHDLIPLDSTPNMRTWATNSSGVFHKLTEGITTLTSCDLSAVLCRPDGKISVVTRDGTGNGDFDDVIFACCADTALSLLRAPSRLEQILLGGVYFPE